MMLVGILNIENAQDNLDILLQAFQSENITLTYVCLRVRTENGIVFKMITVHTHNALQIDKLEVLPPSNRLWGNCRVFMQTPTSIESLFRILTYLKLKNVFSISDDELFCLKNGFL